MTDPNTSDPTPLAPHAAPAPAPAPGAENHAATVRASQRGSAGTHLVVTGVKSRSHLVYIASYVRSVLAQGGPVRVSMIEAPAFLSAPAVTAQDARQMLPLADDLTVEAGMPGWRFADGVRAVYVAVGAPGLKASIALRRANPLRRITCVVTDEGIGTYGSYTSRRDAIARQGVAGPKASSRAALVEASARLLTSQRWPAYEEVDGDWRANPDVMAEFQRDLHGVSPGASDLAVILTQPFVDLGLCDEGSYVVYVQALADASRNAGLHPVVRPHPAERPGRYAGFEVMQRTGTADLDPDVVGAALLLGGPSTALVNLSAMFGARTVWVSEPSLAHLDRDVSTRQAAIFGAFLGAPVAPSQVAAAIRAVL